MKGHLTKVDGNLFLFLHRYLMLMHNTHDYLSEAVNNYILLKRKI